MALGTISRVYHWKVLKDPESRVTLIYLVKVSQIGFDSYLVQRRNSTVLLKPSMSRTWSVSEKHCSSSRIRASVCVCLNEVHPWQVALCVYVRASVPLCQRAKAQLSSLYVHHTKWLLSGHALSIRAHTFEPFSPPSGYCWSAGHGFQSWCSWVFLARGSYPECWWYAHESTLTWGTERTEFRLHRKAHFSNCITKMYH